MSKDDKMLDTSPQVTPPKKINKMLVGLVVGVLAVGVGYFMVPKDEPAKHTSKEITTAAGTNKSMGDTLQDQKQIFERAESNKQGKSPNSSLGEEASTQDINDGDNHGHSHRPSPSSSTSQGYSSTSINSTTRSEPAPTKVSPVERYQEQKELQDLQKRDQFNDARKQADLAAHGSPIFFSSVTDGTKPKDDAQAKTTAQSANDYYNNYADKEYITVIGNGGGR